MFVMRCIYIVYILLHSKIDIGCVHNRQTNQNLNQHLHIWRLAIKHRLSRDKVPEKLM